MSVVLITGVTGFLGSYVSRALYDAGWAVYGITRSASDIVKIRSYVKTYNIDTVSCDEIIDSLQKIDAVIHLATSYGRSAELPSDIARSNVIMPLEILERIVFRHVPVFINADTCYELTYNYLQPYTLSKRQFVEWGQILTKDSSTRFINLKLQHPYGPGDRPSKFVPSIVRKCIDSDVEIPLTLGEQAKDFIYVDDVVDAIQLILSSCQSIPTGFNQLECGSGESTSIRKFVEMVHIATESRAILRFGALPYRENEVMISKADITKLSNFGWKPRVSLTEGIQKVVNEAKRSG